MSNFVCVGLDIRRGVVGSMYSADATVWEQSVDLYQIARRELAIGENLFQLLQPKNKEDMHALMNIIRRFKDITLVSFGMQLDVLKTYPYNEMIYPSMNDLAGRISWTTIGLDVCSIEGFFSFLYMKREYHGAKGLLQSNEWEKAAEMTEAANVEIPSHAPFVIVQLQMHQEC